jgi:DNA repair exonuclease SbcCD ATPase subunit
MAEEEAGRLAQEGSDLRSRTEDRVAHLRVGATTLAAPFGDEMPDLERLAEDVGKARALRDRVARAAADRERLAESERDLAKATRRLRELDERLEALMREAETISFDAERHERLRIGHEEADAALEERRAEERLALEARADVEKSVGELSGRLAEARETEQRVGDLRSQARELERTAMLLDGFRDHLVARVGPELSREAEALFRELTNHEYDDLRIDDETLSIHIADGDTYFPVERFSGSEGDLANLALRVAISIHLSRMAGADLGVMVLDEVLGSLDAERKDLLVRSMGRLAAHFHQLFVITHSEQVKDRFAAAIEVRKTGRRRSVATLA